jgi:leader peptidase (prepilin peptidase)/N-methyltransferase
MTLYFFFLFLILGLSFGSFFNVLIYRIPKGENFITDRSYCPSCQKKLQAFDLIPVLSFIALRGKCRYCKSKISIRYPFIELLTGILFAISYLQFGLSIDLIKILVFISLLIIITFIDLDHMIIPHSLTIGGIVFFFIWHLFFNTGQMSSYLVGLLFGFLSLAIFVFFGAMGGGDAMLMAMFGIYFGVPRAFVTLMLSFIIGGIFSIIILLLKKRSRKEKVPFGPFLTLSALIILFFDYFFLSIYGLN